MGTRFRVYQKHQIDGTRKIVVLSIPTQAELISLKADQGEKKTARFFMERIWEGPPREEGMDDAAYLAAPVPENWEPTVAVFASIEQMDEELTARQSHKLAEALGEGGVPEHLIPYFRDSRRQALGPEPRPNGAEVGDPSLVDTVRAP